MKTRFLRHGFAALGLLSAFMLVSCNSTLSTSSGNSPEDDSDLVTRIIEDGLRDGSDFQKEVLQRAKETGEVSEADWKEANNLYRSCLIEQGFVDVEILYQGSEVRTMSTIPENESESDAEARRARDFACYEKTSAYINELYDYLNGGMQQVEADAVSRAIFTCLLELRLIPEDTTFDELVADADGSQFAPDGAEAEEALDRCLQARVL